MDEGKVACNSKGPESMRVRQPRGRGRGRSATTSSRATSGSGRGRGRGRGAQKNSKRAKPGMAGPQNAGPANNDLSAFGDDDDDDDAMLDQVMSHFEFQTSEIAQGFIAMNKELDLPGFDKTAGDIWIYPTNKPVRDYQFNIVQTALFHNTLVSLPTGLGKTFIAAVVMFNFSRWYPDGLIVFMAPTKPLVAQQLDACHNLMGIPPSKMIELTGQIPPKKREEIWKERNVLFLTPQVMMSDLERGYCPAEKVRLVVVDEAHRSQGNYSYVQVIAKLVEAHKCFRTLALSATPGNDTAAIQGVFKNLLISRVELRSDNSPDVLPYTRQKDIETVVVKLDDQVKQFHDQVVEVFQQYTGKLLQQNAIPSRGATTISQYQLLKAREAFRTASKAKGPGFKTGLIELDFATAVSLAHSLELLNIHGLRSFYSFLHGVIMKEKGNPQVTAELKRNTKVEEILEKIRPLLKIPSDNSSLKLNATGFLTIDDDDETRSNITLGEDVDYFISHPKFKVLREIVKKHFETFAERNQSTRVMIFSQYRDNVQEIGSMLNTLRPIVKPMVFVGQSSNAAVGRGLKQREQVQVMQKFREGGYNVLVSTSVGEEGLDIGEVDLIVCFDCMKSPTRLIQRMGRTGRQRQGRTVFLLTQGKEESMYRASVYQSANINKNILDTTKFDAYLYKETPRMIPLGVQPQCYKMDIILSSEQGELTRKGQRRNSVGSSKSKESLNSPINFQAKNNTPALTLTQCFKKGSEILKKSSKTTAASPAKQEVEVMQVEDENDTTIYLNAPNDGDEVGWNEIDYNKFCKILKIDNVTKDTCVQCVRIPNITYRPEAFDWKMDLNDDDISKSESQLIVRGRELKDILDEVNAEMFANASKKTHCGCGLAYMDDNDFINSEMDLKSELLESALLDETEKKTAKSPTRDEEDVSTDWDSDIDLAGLDFERIPEGVPSKVGQQPQLDACMHEADGFDVSDLPQFDISFLLGEKEQIGKIDHGNAGKPIDVAKPPPSPVFSSRISGNASYQRVQHSPEKLVFSLQDNPGSPVPKTWISPDRDLSPIVTSQSLLRERSRTPEKNNSNAQERNTDDLASSPVYIHKTTIMEALENSPMLDKSFCASTPIRKQKEDSAILPTMLRKNSSSDSESEEFLPPSPEIKSKPVIKQEQLTANRSIETHRFKAPTPLRNPVMYVPSLSNQESNYDIDSNSKSGSDSGKQVNILAATPDSAAPKRRFVFKQKIPKKIVTPPPAEELPSVSFAATLRTVPPELNKTKMGMFNSTNVKNDEDVANELDEMINSQRIAVNPLSTGSHLRALSRNRTRMQKDMNPNLGHETAPKSGWVSVDRPRPTVHFEANRIFGASSKATSGPSNVSKGLEKAKNENRDAVHAHNAVHVQRKKSKKKKRRPQNANPFVEDEASVSGDEGSSDTDETSNSEVEDSFVENTNDPVTESQQIRYLKSTRDVHVPMIHERVERQLQPQNYMSLINITDAEYEEDSFCVKNDEVDYADVGPFTQAMIKAHDELEDEMQAQNPHRRKARIESSSESPASEPRNLIGAGRMNLRSKKRLFSPEPEVKPRRKRILELSSDDDETL